MIRRPPRSTRTDTLFPYATLFRSMTDGGFAITLQTMMRGQRDFGVLAGTIIMQWPVWVGGTALGAVIGATGLDAKAWGLDVLIAGVFATAVLGLYRGSGDILPWLGAVAGTLPARPAGRRVGDERVR